MKEIINEEILYFLAECIVEATFASGDISWLARVEGQPKEMGLF
jgi:hypothetical protein